MSRKCNFISFYPLINPHFSLTAGIQHQQKNRTKKEFFELTNVCLMLRPINFQPCMCKWYYKQSISTRLIYNFMVIFFNIFGVVQCTYRVLNIFWVMFWYWCQFVNELRVYIDCRLCFISTVSGIHLESREEMETKYSGSPNFCLVNTKINWLRHWIADINLLRFCQPITAPGHNESACICSTQFTSLP